MLITKSCIELNNSILRFLYDMELQLLPSYKIDKQKWDDCLINSINPFIYASSVYLDRMADNWDGIVINDYNFIMPIPWRKKFGIKYIYHVPFIQQLGLFGKTFDNKEINACNQLMLASFKYGDYSYNHTNDFDDGSVSKNYILSLASNYRSTSFFYSDKLQANLSKAAKQFFEYSNAYADEAINLFRDLYADRFAHVTENDYQHFYDLCEIKSKENNLIVRKVAANKKVLAINLLLKDKYRMYNLMPCTTPEGRNISAGHFLFDSIIKEFSQTGLIFDFEGSDIPGIENFYKNFGAINQPYKRIHFNQLPVFLKLFKR